MNDIELKNRWVEEERESFKGWDFSHLNGRWCDEELPWDYKEIIMKYLMPKQKLLDMGTGGGEFLLTLEHPYKNTSITEAWEPNVKLCQNTLEPLGICVKQVLDDEKLPFIDNAFDIIINRHESYDVSEVKRILKKDGLFITQQVGGKNNELLSRALIPDFKPLYPDLLLRIETEKFITAGFSIFLQKEYFPYLRFYDVGAIVFYAKIMEWEFPVFSVDECFERLCKLQDILLKQGHIESLEHRFILVARNDKP